MFQRRETRETQNSKAGTSNAESIFSSASIPSTLGDHLGSTSKIVHEDGTPLTPGGVRLYKPWGELRHESDGALATKYRYTGQYEEFSDSKNELYNYGARFYDPALGRFIQADSIIPEASQGTQAWDRFAGMNNNPVRYNDPSGHCVGPLLAVCAFVAGLVAEHTTVVTTVAIVGALFSFVGPSAPDPALINNPAASQQALEQSVFQAGLWLTGGQALVEFGAPFRPALPDSAPVCRCGQCQVQNFSGGNVITNADGTLSDVSVQSKALNGSSVSETQNLLGSFMRNKQMGTSTVGDIKKAGGIVIPDPYPQNPYHAVIDGLTAEELSRIFTPTIPNPNPAPPPPNPLGGPR